MALSKRYMRNQCAFFFLKKTESLITLTDRSNYSFPAIDNEFVLNSYHKGLKRCSLCLSALVSTEWLPWRGRRRS